MTKTNSLIIDLQNAFDQFQEALALEPTDINQDASSLE